MGLSDKRFLEVAGSRRTALAVLASITGLYYLIVAAMQLCGYRYQPPRRRSGAVNAADHSPRRHRLACDHQRDGSLDRVYPHR